jgi:arginine/ornithine transport system substrate-binding protein
MKLLPFLLAAVVGALVTLAPADAQERKLRIGVEGAYPPFSEVGPDGKIKSPRSTRASSMPSWLR